jgi:molybdopterin-guanine dinucleotide biosynthesis protein A
MRVGLLDSLSSYTQQGGRKIDAWTALHRTVLVAFNESGDDPQAFFNANTTAQLQSLENV